MRLRVIDQGEASPVASHAVPYGIAAAMCAGDDPVLTLCTADAPYISIGASQDLAREIDEYTCRSRGLPVLRREVGGGAVLIDRDQLYFHFVFPRRLARERDEALFERFLGPVLATYADLGIAATRVAQDVRADGRKLGASAAGEIGEAVVVAGSFLFDFDRDAFAATLRTADPPALRRALDAQMVTIRELMPAVPTRAEVARLFLDHIVGRLAVAPALDRQAPAEAAAVAEAAARHSDSNWIRVRQAP